MSQTLENTVSGILGSLVPETGKKDLSGVHILAAVSGGADSVALLHLLHRLASSYHYSLSAVTVNHLIRSEEESSSDAKFVENLCSSLMPPVFCNVVNLKPGEVAEEAVERGRGIEEAARFIRYRHFDEIADKTGVSYIMTGHTGTDQLETILMRFFQGTGGAALGGIAPRRGRIIRPLLAVSRAEIVAWLHREGLPWCEDATNTDDKYLRNRIRRHLVPLLDSIIPGWESGVSSVAGKALLDDDLCQKMITVEWKRSGGRMECPASGFASLHPALRLRFLQKGLSLQKVKHRVPFGFLKRIIDAGDNRQKSGTGGFRISGSHLCFIKEGDSVFLGEDIVQNTKSGYLVSICSCGSFCFPFGTITVTGESDAVFLDNRLGPFTLPVNIRSRMAGDSVSTADGRHKTLKKLMNDWSIPESERNLLPIVEQAGKVCAVYGSALGYPDWYVHI